MPATTSPRWHTPYRRLLNLVLRPIAPPWWLGVVVAAAFIAGELALVLLLKRIAPENAFGALFLLGVLVVSAGWDFGLAVATSLVSTVVYVYIHAEGAASHLPAAVVFLTLALLTNVIAGQARLRALEAEQRRLEADLSAELARSTLRAEDLQAALTAAGSRIADVLDLPFAVLDLGQPKPDAQQAAITLRDGGDVVGTLLVPAELRPSARDRVARIVPSLEALMAATQDRREITDELEESHNAVTALAAQQAALRRVATAVARGADPTDVFPLVVEELARGIGLAHVTLVGFDADGTAVVLAARDNADRPTMTVGERFPLDDGDSLSSRIHATGTPQRIDDYDDTDSVIAARLRELHVCSGVGAPVIVDGVVRGALVAGSIVDTPLPPDTEDRVCDFADLLATAIFNAENRAELKASRARIVAASDDARRRFERDLHDGAQQRIVTIGLHLRNLDTPEGPVRDAVEHAIANLTDVNTDLQELSRGIHPAILSRGGIGPAIKTLARRSAVPTAVDIDVDGRLPDSVEVAAYYVVAEALTNIAKHAQASEAQVCASVDDGALRIEVRDDGVGGASTTGGGSGLIGLKDRIEAVSGRLDVASTPGAGTTLTVTIPLTA
jgi:signal transduction histidine kinase